MTCRGQSLAGTAKGNVSNCSGMTFEGEEFFPGARGPNPHALGVTGGSYNTLAPGNSDPCHRPFVPLKGKTQNAISRVPDLYGLVITRRDQFFAVPAKGYARHVGFVSFEGKKIL